MLKKQNQRVNFAVSKHSPSYPDFLDIQKYHANLSQSPNFYRVDKWGDLGGEFIFLKQK